MAEFDQSNNPYTPPVSTVEVVPVAERAESDELQDDLTRAFYAVTYGTVFLPGLAYCVCSVFISEDILAPIRVFASAPSQFYDHGRYLHDSGACSIAS